MGKIAYDALGRKFVQGWLLPLFIEKKEYTLLSEQGKLDEYLNPIEHFPHPELEEDEVFLCNVSDDEAGKKLFDSFKFDTKRMVGKAYDMGLNPVKGLKAVFIKREEKQEKLKLVNNNSYKFVKQFVVGS